MQRRQLMAATAGLALAQPALAQPALVQPAGAAAWPQRPVRLILPFSAGGGTDATSRLLAQRLAALTGQPFVIDNRGGAGGDIAILAGIAAAPDGHTLVMGSDGSHVRGQVLRTDMPYDADAALRPVARLVETWSAFVIPASLPAPDLAGFAAFARASPQPVSYGTAGPGTLSHVIAELFARQQGVPAVHVPYRGAALAIPDLLAGRLTYQVPAVGGLIPLLASPAVRVLAVTGPHRQPALPAPTLEEAGFPDLNLNTWYGFFAPSGTPGAVVARISALFGQVMAEPAIGAKLDEMGLVPAYLDAAAFGASIQAQRGRWRALIGRTGLRL